MEVEEGAGRSSKTEKESDDGRLTGLATCALVIWNESFEVVFRDVGTGDLLRDEEDEEEEGMGDRPPTGGLNGFPLDT